MNILRKDTARLLSQAGVEWSDCAGCCIGLPCYGENPEIDSFIVKQMEKAFAPVPVHIVNDAEVGWAGSLECHEGIHVVAGHRLHCIWPWMRWPKRPQRRLGRILRG